MVPTAPQTQRPLRADAQRNRDRLLEAAEKVFATRGTEASLEEIARRAGVGVGTLYRHFPSRHDLIESLIRERAQAMSDKGNKLLEADDPFRALRTWLQAALKQNAIFSGLAESLVMADCGSSRLGSTCQDQKAVCAALLDRAKKAGQVRSDVTADDLFELVNGVAWVSERGGRRGNGNRLLNIVLDGLRPAAS